MKFPTLTANDLKKRFLAKYSLCEASSRVIPVSVSDLLDILAPEAWGVTASVSSILGGDLITQAYHPLALSNYSEPKLFAL
jgi:hypothetical protein